MTGLRELRQTLVDHEHLAPDADGIVEAARVRAVRIRRRRRIGAVAGTVVALALVAALVPGVASRLHRAPTTPAVPERYRGSAQMTVSLDPAGDYDPQMYGVRGTTQYIVARSKSDSVKYTGATVTVHDPGTYDAGQLRAGRPVTVRGHAGYYVAGLASPQESLAMLGWQDPSRAWVVLLTSSWTIGSLDQMLRVADDLRFAPPRDVTTPYRLGHVPLGLTPTATITGADNTSFLDLGGHPQWDGLFPSRSVPDQDVPLILHAYAQARPPTTLGSPTGTIAGYPVWYATAPNALPVHAINGSALNVFAHGCDMTIFVADRGRITYDDLVRFVEDIRFGDCAKPATWTPPLS